MALLTLTIIIIGFILFFLFLLAIVIRNLFLTAGYLFFGKVKLDDLLVELAYVFGKRAKDKALTGVIGEAKKIISLNPNLLALSSVWVDLIEYIRETQSKEAQLVFFQYIFKNTKFPNHEKLAAYLVEIINISWFNPPSKPDKQTLENLADKCIKEFRLYTYEEDDKMKSYKIDAVEFIEDNWEKALSADRSLVLSAETLQKFSRDKYLDAIHHIIFGIIWSANPEDTPSDNRYLDSALRVAEQLAELIIMEDKLKENKNNILSHFMELYKLGVWPIGVVEKVTDRIKVVYKFVVFIPPSVKAKKDSTNTPFFFMKVWQVNKQMTEVLGGDIKGQTSRFKSFVKPN